MHIVLKLQVLQGTLKPQIVLLFCYLLPSLVVETQWLHVLYYVVSAFQLLERKKVNYRLFVDVQYSRIFFRNVQTNFASNCLVERSQIWVDELFNKSEGKLTQVVTWRLWLGHSIREESFSCCFLVSARVQLSQHKPPR